MIQFLCFLGFSGFLLAGCQQDSVASRLDSGQTGWASVPLRGTPSVLWTADLGGVPLGAPLVGANVFVVTSSEIVALSPEDGKVVWKAPVRGATTGAAGFGDLIMVGTGDGQVIAFSNAGAEQWRTSVGGAVWDTPVGGEELVVSTSAGEIVGLDNNGKERWRAKTAGPVVSRVAVDGAFVAAASGDGHVYAFDRNTHLLLWKWAGSGPLTDGAMVDAHGVVFAADHALRSLNRQTGVMAWSVPMVAQANGRPVMNDTQVFVLDDSGNLMGVDRKSGTKTWEVQVEPAWGALSGAGEQVLVTQPDGLIGLDARTGVGVWEVDLGGEPRWAPSVQDRRVFVAVGQELVAVAFQP